MFSKYSQSKSDVYQNPKQSFFFCFLKNTLRNDDGELPWQAPLALGGKRQQFCTLRTTSHRDNYVAIVDVPFSLLLVLSLAHRNKLRVLRQHVQLKPNHFCVYST